MVTMPRTVAVVGDGQRFEQRFREVRRRWDVRGFTPAEAIDWAASPASRFGAVALVVEGAAPCLTARSIRVAAPWVDVVIDTAEPLPEVDRVWMRRAGVLHLVHGPMMWHELDALLYATVRRGAGIG